VNRVFGVVREPSVLLTEWTVQYDPAPDRTPPTYVLTCVSDDPNGTRCGATSGPVPSMTETSQWAAHHAQSHSHPLFRLLADVAMLATPATEGRLLP
jgi:hypothetical protein